MAHKKTESLEREDTYEGGRDCRMPDLGGLPGVARVTGAPAEDLDAVYYDTEGMALLGAGVTLRRRSGGHDAGWHLKLPAGPGARQEIRVPLEEDGPDGMPAGIARHVAARARGRELLPVARLRTHRERLLLRDARDRVLAEVASDTVSAQVMGTAHDERPEGGTGATLTSWSEVEIELRRGGERLMTAAGRRLRGAGLRPVPGATKLGHALSDAGLAPAGAGGTAPGPRDGTAGAVVRDRLRELTAALLTADAAVRADAPDGVHSMRTTVRRLRSALKTYRRLFRPGSTRRLEHELRHLADVLGEARDHEVLADRLASAAGPGPDDSPAAHAARSLAAREREAYRRTWALAGRALDDARYYALLDALDTFTAAPPTTAAAGRDARRELSRAARRTRRTVERRAARAQAAPPGPERDRALHATRKAAKRLRYAAETATPVVGKKAERVARRAKAVQKVLGEHQDAVVACDRLPAFAARDHAAGDNTFGHGVLHARQREAADRAERALAGPLAKALRRKATHW